MLAVLEEALKDRETNGYIYLRSQDILIDRITEEYTNMFDRRNRIYTTGVSEIYR
jgi:hypothetical protein